MASMPAPSPPPPLESSLGYHGAVSAFKRRLIEATLHQVSGNRTHAARVLGLQRTYLLRLIRELGVAAPPPPTRRRRSEEHTSELQSLAYLVCRLLLEKKKQTHDAHAAQEIE